MSKNIGSYGAGVSIYSYSGFWYTDPGLGSLVFPRFGANKPTFLYFST